MRNCNTPNQCGQTTSCGMETSCPKSRYEIAMAYVPWQKFDHIYEPEKGLEIGTIFAELDKPFYGRRAVRK